MRLGLYIFATVVLIAIVAIFTYTMNPDYYAVELMGINFNLPIAVWIILPMIILFLFTVIHILFYGLKNYFLLKKWQKDTNTLEDALYWSLLNEPKVQKYGIDALGRSAVILGKSSLDVSGNVEGLTPRLAYLIDIIQKIKNGIYIDLKEEKLSKVFSAGNPILIQNRLNQIEVDSQFTEDVLRSTSEYSLQVHDRALEVFAMNENFTKSQKYVKVFDVKNFLVMLNRVEPENGLELTSEILTSFVKALTLNCEDFINIALVTKKYFKPEENLLLFRSYQDENEKAQNAYLYLLFEYELSDQVGVYLDEQEETDFMKFRAFYALKKQHSKYRLEDIIDIHSVCTETKPY